MLIFSMHATSVQIFFASIAEIIINPNLYFIASVQ